MDESCEGGHVWRVKRSAWRSGRKESVERHLDGIVRPSGWIGLARSRDQRCSSGRCSLCDQIENIGRENRAGKLKNFHLTQLCLSTRGCEVRVGKLLEDPDLQEEGEDRSKDSETASIWVLVKVTRVSRKSETRMRSRPGMCQAVRGEQSARKEDEEAGEL